jgi:hypothetical protein
MLVANLEMRFPLLGLFSADVLRPVPGRRVVFTDAGVAWGSGSRPSVLGGEVDPVTSAGFGHPRQRLGFAVVELDLVRPFDRPTAGLGLAVRVHAGLLIREPVT